MGTRCQVKVIQEGLRELGGANWEEAITLYHHWDGYPENMVPLFAKAFERFGTGYEAGRAGHVASFLCATDPKGFQPEDSHELHGDIEYYYKLYCVNTANGSMAEIPRWEVAIFDGSGGRRIRPRTEVLKAAKKYSHQRKGIGTVEIMAHKVQIVPGEVGSMCNLEEILIEVPMLKLDAKPSSPTVFKIQTDVGLAETFWKTNFPHIPYEVVGREVAQITAGEPYGEKQKKKRGSKSALPS